MPIIPAGYSSVSALSRPCPWLRCWGLAKAPGNGKYRRRKERFILASHCRCEFASAQLEYRFAHQFYQPRTAVVDVSNDFLAHARVPESFHMLRHAVHSHCVIRLGLEKIPNVVRHANQMFNIHAFQSSLLVRRYALSAYTTQRSPRTNPASVIPDSPAIRTASAVGADTAASKPIPAIAAFCTIS